MTIFMHTPQFWMHKNLLSSLLLPLAWLYALAGRLRWWMARPIVLGVPVICVGNLTAGGAGKTPLALHLGEIAKTRGLPVFFLSRGYGGSAINPLRVDPQQHTANEVGDEPLLLAQCLPTIVAKDRLAGARLAIAQGAQAIIMDDGLQNPALKKTYSLVVIDGKNGVGNGRVIPAGPLREPLQLGLSRADAVVIMGEGAQTPALPTKLPVFHASMVASDASALEGKRLIAFCGIASPQKFFDTLARIDANVLETQSYPDHYAYSEKDMQALFARAAAKNAQLITTEKDAARLTKAQRAQVLILPVRLQCDAATALEIAFLRALGKNMLHAT